MIRRTIRPAGAVAPAADVGRAPNGATMQVSGAKAWSPTVANLLVLVVLEIVAFGVIRYVFQRVTD